MLIVFVVDGLVNLYLIRIFIMRFEEIIKIFDFIIYEKVCMYLFVKRFFKVSK